MDLSKGVNDMLEAMALASLPSRPEDNVSQHAMLARLIEDMDVPAIAAVERAVIGLRTST